MLKVDKSKSFTLIELLFVLIIIGVLVAVAIPRLKKSLFSLEFNATVSQLKTVIEFLHQRAIVESKTMTLTFDSKNNLYYAQIPGATVKLKTYKIPDSISIETEAKDFFFYPDGSINKADILIRAQGYKTITLTTKGVWGGVKEK